MKNNVQITLEGRVVGRNWYGQTCIKDFCKTYQTVKLFGYNQHTTWKFLQWHIAAICTDGDFSGIAKILDCEITVKKFSHNGRTHKVETFSRMLDPEQLHKIANYFVPEESKWTYYDMLSDSDYDNAV